MKALRQGVTRVRDEIAALVGEPVAEVTGARPAGDAPPATRVVVGTEATLHQVDRADVVAFLDLDQELLAPRYRAAEQAFALVARAARLVGGKEGGGRLVLQTFVPRHEVVQAALHADPVRVAAAERDRRELLRFPPATALPRCRARRRRRSSTPSASPLGIEVIGPADGRWLVRAPDHTTLCDALAGGAAPARAAAGGGRPGEGLTPRSQAGAPAAAVRVRRQLAPKVAACRRSIGCRAPTGEPS